MAKSALDRMLDAGEAAEEERLVLKGINLELRAELTLYKIALDVAAMELGCLYHHAEPSIREEKVARLLEYARREIEKGAGNGVPDVG